MSWCRASSGTREYVVIILPPATLSCEPHKQDCILEASAFCVFVYTYLLMRSCFFNVCLLLFMYMYIHLFHTCMRSFVFMHAACAHTRINLLFSLSLCIYICIHIYTYDSLMVSYRRLCVLLPWRMTHALVINYVLCIGSKGGWIDRKIDAVSVCLPVCLARMYAGM